MRFPPNVATADEEIPAIDNTDCWAGPDLHSAQASDAMLLKLSEFDDDEVGYVDCWLELLGSVGGTAHAEYSAEGDVRLSVGVPCDTQMRHRWRWTHILAHDLDRLDGRRSLLLRRLRRSGWVIDMRPREAQATTIAMRNFIRAGGRILVTPEGHIEEGGGVPRALYDGSPQDVNECLLAGRAYLDVRKHFRADSQIRRAAKMLGHKTANGWWVLEAARG